jgi:hypothetical protein
MRGKKVDLETRSPLKDGKYLLVVQYIQHGPFRPSMCGALKWQQAQQRATGNNGGIDRSPRDR